MQTCRVSVSSAIQSGRGGGRSRAPWSRSRSSWSCWRRSVTGPWGVCAASLAALRLTWRDVWRGASECYVLPEITLQMPKIQNRTPEGSHLKSDLLRPYRTSCDAVRMEEFCQRRNPFGVGGERGEVTSYMSWFALSSAPRLDQQASRTGECDQLICMRAGSKQTATIESPLARPGTQLCQCWHNDMNLQILEKNTRQ